MPELARPNRSDCADYYWLYIDQVPEGEVLDLLDTGVRATAELLRGLPDDWQGYRYADGKWNVREVVAHMIDAERLFAYRGLSFARNDPAPLPGMDQDIWTAAANADGRSLDDLVDELESLRRSHVLMFRGLANEAWDRRGTASGVEFAVRSIPFILAGHEIHHRKVLEERYLLPLRS